MDGRGRDEGWTSDGTWSFESVHDSMAEASGLGYAAEPNFSNLYAIYHQMDPFIISTDHAVSNASTNSLKT